MSRLWPNNIALHSNQNAISYSGYNVDVGKRHARFLYTNDQARYTDDFAGITDDHLHVLTEFSRYTNDNDQKRKKKPILHHLTRNIKKDNN